MFIVRRNGADREWLNKQLREASDIFRIIRSSGFIPNCAQWDFILTD